LLGRQQTLDPRSGLIALQVQDRCRSPPFFAAPSQITILSGSRSLFFSLLAYYLEFRVSLLSPSPLQCRSQPLLFLFPLFFFSISSKKKSLTRVSNPGFVRACVSLNSFPSPETPPASGSGGDSRFLLSDSSGTSHRLSVSPLGPREGETVVSLSRETSIVVNLSPRSCLVTWSIYDCETFLLATRKTVCVSATLHRKDRLFLSFSADLCLRCSFPSACGDHSEIPPRDRRLSMYRNAEPPFFPLGSRKFPVVNDSPFTSESNHHQILFVLKTVMFFFPAPF